MENLPALEEYVGHVFDTGLTIITAYGLKVIGALVILTIGWIAAGMVQRAILRAGQRSTRLDHTLTGFAASIVRYAVLTFTIIAVLGTFGVETTSFIAVLGAVGLAVGLALQGTLGHAASGILLIVFRPFKGGDVIEAGGVLGTVQAITLFTTEVATPENVKVIIPNGMVWGGMIRNFTAHPTRRSDLIVGISYDDDIDKAMAVVKTLLDAESRILTAPEYLIAVHALADSSVNLLIRFWTSKDDFYAVQLDLNKAIKTAFDDAGVTIPFPQRVVRHIEVAAPR
jgi:small conductance mechanosensitive channel